MVDGKTLTRVIGYLTKHTDGDVSDEEKRDFDEEFVAQMDMSVMFEVVLAANYLNIKEEEQIKHEHAWAWEGVQSDDDD
ncbi:UNVERIFIED_CONTAM: hypothetical protein Slati_1621600 [Sesamum latifolium]|uniref:SKP1 component POZ domain-containing protein n=1 Tax=Sesamum latifolium TaxID=2727402 RepID=A0AAW2X9H7_9LAMI